MRRALVIAVVVLSGLAAEQGLAADAPRLTLEEYRELGDLYKEAAAKRFRDKEATGRLDKATTEKIDRVLGSLASGNGLEKELAAGLLGRASDERAPGALAAALSDEDESVRRVVISSLWRMKPEQIKTQKEKLLAAFEDDDEVVRMGAVRTVGKLKDEGAVEKLTSVLADESWRVRLAAVQAIGALKEKAKEAVPDLEKLLEDEHAFVRMFAARAIFMITGEAPPGMAGKQRKNPLKEIHGLMGEASDRLRAKNVGVPTREVQKRIVADLDTLITALEKSQPKGGGGGGKGKGKKQSKGQGKGQGKGGKPTSGTKGGQNPSSPMQDSFTTSGATTHGAKRAVVLEEGAKWGNLPDKLREEVDQALKDRFPDRYKELLKRYYTRISDDEE